MRPLLLLAVSSFMVLPLFAYADVAEDIQNKQPSNIVVANAAGLTYPELFTAVDTADSLQIPNIVAVTVTNIPDDTALIVESAIQVAPELLEEIVTAAIQTAPSLAPLIVSIAIKYGANPDTIAALAIAASPLVDPTAVTEATAAGGLDTVADIPNPTVLAGNGGGGGNSASPN